MAEGVFSREVGKYLGRLKRKREASDYDDFYVASYEETIEHFQYAEKIVAEIKKIFLIYVSNIVKVQKHVFKRRYYKNGWPGNL